MATTHMNNTLFMGKIMGGNVAGHYQDHGHYHQQQQQIVYPQNPYAPSGYGGAYNNNTATYAGSYNQGYGTTSHHHHHNVSNSNNNHNNGQHQQHNITSSHNVSSLTSSYSDGYHGSSHRSSYKFSKASALLHSSEPIPTTNLKAHDPLDKKALDSWRSFKVAEQRKYASSSPSSSDSDDYHYAN